MLTGINEYGRLRRVAMRRPADAMIDQQTIDREWRDLTLMMVTTESEQSQIVRALAAGAHEYLIKPFTPDALMAKLDMLGLLPTKELA